MGNLACSTCTANAPDAFVLEINDRETGASICDADVVVEDGAFHETLSKSCHPAEARERPGSYTVKISRQGYVSRTVSIAVTSDECHVRTRAVTVELEPERS